MSKSVENHPGAKLHRTRRVDEHVDLIGSRKQERVFSDDRRAPTNGVFQSDLTVRLDHFRETAILVQIARPVDPSAVDRDQAHTGRTIHDAIRKATRHEARAQHAHANGSIVIRPMFQRIIDNDHVLPMRSDYCPSPLTLGAPMRSFNAGSISSSNGQTRSLSEMAVTGSGQLSPSRGSSCLKPLSKPGA